jgi:Putative zinc-finger
MCDDRERLIGYVYDECDPVERQQIEAHLAECETCRAEIGGLRAVRQDLLAWHVPQSQGIWRPLPAAPRALPWQAMPTWALAAAAGLVLVVGAAGGAVATRFVPGPAPTGAVQVVAPAPVVPAAAAVTPADLSALEQRVLAEMRSEMDDRVVHLMAAHQVAPQSRDLESLSQRVDRQGRQLADLTNAVYADVVQLNRTLNRTQAVQEGNRMILTALDLEGAPRPSR